MRKLSVLLLLPMILTGASGRWDFTYTGNREDSTVIVRAVTKHYAILSDSIAWNSTSGDSLISDSVYIFPDDPFTFTALQGFDNSSLYFQQASKPADFAKLNSWTLLKTIGSVTTVPEYRLAIGDVLYAEPWVRFKLVADATVNRTALEMRIIFISTNKTE